MDGEPTLEVTAEDVHVFTNGGCHILARHIHDLTGWAMCAWLFGCPCLHVFVVTPEGHALDVEGLSDMDAFRDKWRVNGERPAVTETCWDELMSHGSKWPREDAHTSMRAGELAQHLIAQARCGLSPESAPART
jgi:hypothetical protein